MRRRGMAEVVVVNEKELGKELTKCHHLQKSYFVIVEQKGGEREPGQETKHRRGRVTPHFLLRSYRREADSGR